MREPMQWTFPIGRLFDVAVRVHILLPVVLLGLGLRALKDVPKDNPDAIWIVATVGAIILVSVILHEFGHVFAARAVGGDCEEVVLWPLGGLAMCDLPPMPRAHFLTALAGPLVNLGLCVLTPAFLLGQMIAPPINLFSATSNPIFPTLYDWSSSEAVQATWYQLLAARIFWVNWVLFCFNLLPAFPMDGGRMLHSILWARTDETSAYGSVAYIGFGFMLVLLCVAFYVESVMLALVSWFIYVNCKQLVMRAEGMLTDEGGFHVEGDEPAPRKHRPGWFQRWKQERAARLARQEQEDRETEERRLDELLDKVQRLGKQSLTAEEERFLNRVSARYRNNKS